MNETHQRIIAAAKELFEKKGFAAATTKEIARPCKCQRGNALSAF